MTATLPQDEPTPISDAAKLVMFNFALAAIGHDRDLLTGATEGVRIFIRNLESRCRALEGENRELREKAELIDWFASNAYMIATGSEGEVGDEVWYVVPNVWEDESGDEPPPYPSARTPLDAIRATRAALLAHPTELVEDDGSETPHE